MQNNTLTFYKVVVRDGTVLTKGTLKRGGIPEIGMN